MKKEKNGVQIHIDRQEKTGRVGRIIADIVATILIAAALWLMIYHGLGLEKTGTSWLTGGLPVLADRFMDRLTILTLKIHSGVEGSGSFIDTVFTPLMIVISAVLAYLSIRFKNWALWIVFALIGVAGALTGILPFNVWTIIYFAVIVLAAIYKAYRESACRKHYRNAAILALGTGILTALFAVLFAFTISDRMPDLSGIKTKAEDYLHKKQYETHKNPMPEGKVAAAGALDADTSPALEVSEAVWETTYLKGFVGEDYDGKAWVRIRDEEIAEDADMFYWLHENGFYGQDQTGAAYEAAGNRADGFVSVTNLRACRNYCYVPYGVNMQDTSLLDEKDIGDLNIKVADPELSADNIFPVVSGAEGSSRSLQRSLNEQEADPLVSSYLDKEETYRKYCRRRYLNIPEDVKEAIAGCLGEQENLQPAEAMERILEYMNSNLRYSEKAAKAGNQDFIVKFLTDSKKGYAIQYASAAVMMMRYFGVPARYAEGFIVPETLYRDAAEMSSISVTMRYAHAWAEYYLDGVGWLPFETVPKYQTSGKGSGTEQTGGKEKQENKKKNQKETENPMNRHGYIFVLNLPLLIGCIGAIVLALLLIFILRRVRLRKFLKTFRGPDRNLAVSNAFAYAIAMLKAAGLKINSTLLRESLSLPELDEKAKAQMEQCITINEDIRYGDGQASEEQRNAVLAFKDSCLQIYKNKNSRPRKIRDWLIRCIY